MTLKTTIAFVPTFRKFFASDATALWAGLRRISCRYFYYSTTSICSFVAEHIQEDRPCSIVYRLGKHTSGQPFDIQLLYSNQGVAINQSFGQLVQEVLALITNFAVAPGYPLSVFFPFGMGADNFSKLPLLLGKPRLPLSVVARILYLLASRQVCKVFQTNVNPDSRSGVRRNSNLTFHREAHKPLVTFPLDLYCLDFAQNCAVQLDFESAYLRESESIILEGPPQLRVGETIVSVKRAKTRKARFIATLHTSVESLESLIYSVKDILQGLAVHVRKVRSNLFALYQRGGLLCEIDARTCHTIGIPTVLEGSVIQLTAQVEVVLQEPCLPLSRKESVFVGTPGEQLDTLLSVNVLLDSFSRDISGSRGKVASGPQTGEFQQVWILLSEVVRRSAFHFSHYISGAVSRSYPDKQVDMVRQNGKLQYLPVLRNTDFLNKSFAILRHVFDKHALTSLRTKDKVVHDEMYPMFVTLIIHALSIHDSCYFGKSIYKSGTHWRNYECNFIHLTTAPKGAWL